jgi:small multidrug resistance pump
MCAECGKMHSRAFCPIPYQAVRGNNWAMGNTSLAILVTIVFSVIGVVGDYFLKLASAKDESLKSPAFYIGFLLYASTAFGWVFVMKHLKLATVGVLYSVSMVLLLTAVGVVAFKESLNGYEILGLVMAVGSLLLLTRFN